MEVDGDCLWKILSGDEAHFYLNGTVNTRNYRIRDDRLPNVVKEILLHLPKVTIWCGFTAEIVIGSFF